MEYLNESWMPSASEMGLSDQDLADLAALKTTGSSVTDSETVNSGEPIPPGNEPGWQVLTGDDFVNVNCFDTWKWDRDMRIAQESRCDTLSRTTRGF